MYRAVPTGNRLLEERWNRWQMKQHKQRLRSMKPIINTFHTGHKMNHTIRNFKREQLFEGIVLHIIDRCTEIERENRILLEKMTQIMQVHRPYSRPLGKCSQSFGLSELGEKRSLNKAARRRDLVKIAQENQAMLKRLQNKQPNYQVGMLCEEYKNKQKILKNICVHPLVLNVHRESTVLQY